MDIYSTAVLAGVVAYLPKPQSWLLDRYFPRVVISDTEDIYFDVQNGKRRLSPFVSPLVQGKIVDSQGFRTNILRPAYIKDKRVFDPTRPLRRAIGERIGGEIMSPQDRSEMNLRTEMEDQVNMITRRMEWMAAQALALGQITISGEKYQTVVVNFGRTSTQQIVLTSGNKWGDTGVSILDYLQDWSQGLVFKSSGAMPVDVVMDVAAWKVFRRDAEVQKRWAAFNQNAANLKFDSQQGSGGVYMGTLDGFNFWIYSDYYVDETDTEQPMLPTGTVMLLSPQLEGVRHFGAIKDHEAGFQSLPYWPKSWVEPDPSVRYLMMQSAPLVVPYRPNAGLAASVL